MKKNLFIWTLISFSLVSCEDFMNLEPEYQINDQSFYKGGNDFEALVMGCYSGLQSIHNSSFPYLTELTTDNVFITLQSPGINELECDEMNITANNGYVNTMWSASYTTIARCNNLINRIDDSELTEDQKRQYSGEAHFIRAYCYFNLVRFFGKLPLVEADFRSPGEVNEFNMTRQDTERVDSLIVADLKTADQLLSGVSTLSKGRASSGAAKTLLGKFYLTRKNYTDAAGYLEQVIAAEQYTLADDYASLFSKSNDDLAESIFEIKYLSGNLGEGNSFALQQVPVLYGGMALFPGNQLGGGRLSPTPQMAGSYEAGDLRKDASVSENVPLNDGTTYKMWYGKKFVDFTANPVTDMDNNFTALRYADVLLMYAEVLNELGQTAEAYPYINQVRERAGLSPLAALSKNELTAALEKERKVEFLNEGHRWFDLVRTGRARTVLNDYFQANNLSFTLEDHELLMPIPQRELDIDPDLEQNPGY